MGFLDREKRENNSKKFTREIRKFPRTEGHESLDLKNLHAHRVQHNELKFSHIKFHNSTVKFQNREDNFYKLSEREKKR